MSVLFDILTDVKRIQDNLQLMVDGKLITTVLRKLPKREEPVDLAYQCTISAAEQVEESTRIGFKGKWRVVYKVEITLITPNDGDQLYSLKDHTNWRDTTQAAYMGTSPLVRVAEVKGVDLKEGPMLLRSKLRQGYDYNQVSLLVTTYESRP